MIFVLKMRPHTAFERSGNDLLTKVHITLSEALLGFSRILLTHLDGRGIYVTSPKGKVFKPGDSIVIRGEGMPLRKTPDQKGHLYVIFEVDFPDDNWVKTVDTEVSITCATRVFRSAHHCNFRLSGSSSHQKSRRLTPNLL